MRSITIVALVTTSPLLAAIATAADAPALPRHQLMSSWRTIVIPVSPGAPPRAKPITTATLGRASVPSHATPKPLTGIAHQFDGLASFYWQAQKTASGEVFNPADMTAAHRTLPFGTKVRVTHTTSGRAVVVRINDRGPFKAGRVIDLSKAAAEHLQMTGAGLAAVKLEVVH